MFLCQRTISQRTIKTILFPTLLAAQAGKLAITCNYVTLSNSRGFLKSTLAEFSFKRRLKDSFISFLFSYLSYFYISHYI